jgi:hypothetical protein
VKRRDYIGYRKWMDGQSAINSSIQSVDRREEGERVAEGLVRIGSGKDEDRYC